MHGRYEWTESTIFKLNFFMVDSMRRVFLFVLFCFLWFHFVGIYGLAELLCHITCVYESRSELKVQFQNELFYGWPYGEIFLRFHFCGVCGLAQLLCHITCVYESVSEVKALFQNELFMVDYMRRVFLRFHFGGVCGLAQLLSHITCICNNYGLTICCYQALCSLPNRFKYLARASASPIVCLIKKLLLPLSNTHVAAHVRIYIICTIFFSLFFSETKLVLFKGKTHQSLGCKLNFVSSNNIFCTFHYGSAWCFPVLTFVDPHFHF